jgi:hypothetical protein
MIAQSHAPISQHTKQTNRVPVSQDEEADTEVVRTWGTPRTGDDLLHHHDLLWCVRLMYIHLIDWLIDGSN